jgi:hypothetical protein
MNVDFMQKFTFFMSLQCYVVVLQVHILETKSTAGKILRGCAKAQSCKCSLILLYLRMHSEVAKALLISRRVITLQFFKSIHSFQFNNKGLLRTSLSLTLCSIHN